VPKAIVDKEEAGVNTREFAMKRTVIVGSARGETFSNDSIHQRRALYNPSCHSLLGFERAIANCISQALGYLMHQFIPVANNVKIYFPVFYKLNGREALDTWKCSRG